MYRFILLSIIICFAAFFNTNAQDKCSIKGKITSEDGMAVPSAQVLLLRKTDSTIISYVLSDLEGNYFLKTPCKKSFLLKVNSLNFKAQYETFLGITVTDSLNFQLKEEVFELKAVEIKGDRPITTQGDTSIYAVSYFRNGEERTAEDVLKKLPGIDIDNNGKISYQGKEVTNVLLDGDDLAGSNYQLITKNLSADLLDKVDILKNYTDESLLRGIAETEDIAINLKIKEGKKAPLFGHVGAKSNFYDRYSINTNLLSYHKKFKAVFLGQGNNLGKNPTFYENYEGGFSALSPAFNSSLPVSNGIRSGLLKPEDYAQNNSQYGSLNLINNKGKFKFNNHFSFANLSTQVAQFSNTVFFDENEITFQRNDQFDTKTSLLNNKLNWSYAINPRTKITLKSAVLIENKTNGGNYLFNGVGINDQTKNQKLLIANRIEYGKKLNNQSALLLNITHQHEQKDQHYFTDTNSLFPEGSREESVSQSANSPFDLIELSGRYVRKYDKWQVSNIASLQQINGDLENLINLDNALVNQEGFAYAGQNIMLTSSIKRKFKNSSIALNPSISSSLIKIGNTTSERTHNLLFNPSLILKHQIGHVKLASIFLRNASIGSINLLLDEPQVNNYFSFSRANFDFLPVFRDFTAILKLNIGNESQLSSLYASLLWSREAVGIQNIFQLEPNGFSNIQQIGQGSQLTTLTTGYDAYLNFIKSTVKLKTNLSRSNFPISFDEDIIFSTVNNLSIDGSITTSARSIVNVTLSYSNSISWSDIDNNGNTGFEKVTFRLLVKPNKAFRFTLFSTAYFTNSGESTYLFNSIFTYLLNDRMTLGLEGRNLFNRQNFLLEQTSSRSRFFSGTTLFPRYLVAKVSFQL